MRAARARAAERGAVAVEAALLMLVMVPLLLYAIFFTDIGMARIKAREASRYLAWETAAVTSSDWRGGDHRACFERARRAIVAEVVARWGDDLDGATPTLVRGSRAGLLTISTEVLGSGVDVTSSDISAPARGGDGSAVALAGELAVVLNRFGLNAEGYLDARVAVGAENRGLGTAPLVGRLLASDRFRLLARQALIADAWSLTDGSDVADASAGTCESDYCRQLQRMVFAGVRDPRAEVSGGALLRLMRGFGVHDPLQPAVASRRLDAQAHLTSAIEQAVADPHGRAAMRKHYTNAFKDTFVRERSALNRLYQRLGPHYLGCPEAQREEGECTYAPQ